MVFQASSTDVSPFLNVKRTGTPSWGYLSNTKRSLSWCIQKKQKKQKKKRGFDEYTSSKVIQVQYTSSNTLQTLSNFTQRRPTSLCRGWVKQCKKSNTRRKTRTVPKTCIERGPCINPTGTPTGTPTCWTAP